MDQALIIAKYKEDLSWVKDIEGFKIYVYDKSDEQNDYVHITNIGREANTYLYHIVENYTTLSDWNVFVQGNPMDHIKGEKLRIDGPHPQHFAPIGVHLRGTPDSRDPGILSVDAARWPEAVNIQVCEEICRIIEKPFTDHVIYSPGGMFGVSKERILSYPIKTYQRLLNLSEAHPSFAWCMERLWTKMYV